MSSDTFWEDKPDEWGEQPDETERKRIKLARELGLDWVPCTWDRYAYDVHRGGTAKIGEVYDENELERLWLVVEELANRLGIKPEGG